MNEQKLISVVIPVYNCEKQLARCLDSVINQTYKPLEIIIVNDGSTDETANVCKDYAAKYENMIFIDQENQGAIAARRTGANVAKGTFLGFVDADDYIEADMYETLARYINCAEMVSLGYTYKGNVVYDSFDEGLYKGKEQLKKFYKNMLLVRNTYRYGISTSMCNKLFIAGKAKSIFEGLDSEIFMGEDAEFVYKYALSVDSIYILKECKYHYEDNPNSTMNSTNPNYLKNVSCLYLSLKAFFEQSEYKEILLPQLGDWILDLISRISHFMGIYPTISDRVVYSNDSFGELSGKKIALYGAGNVGKNYYALFRRKFYREVVLWVDRKWEHYQEVGLCVEPVEELRNVQYDLVVIAVKNEEMKDTISKELSDMGIPQEKIWWKPPVYIGNLV